MRFLWCRRFFRFHLHMRPLMCCCKPLITQSTWIHIPRTRQHEATLISRPRPSVDLICWFEDDQGTLCSLWEVGKRIEIPTNRSMWIDRCNQIMDLDASKDMVWIYVIYCYLIVDVCLMDMIHLILLLFIWTRCTQYGGILLPGLDF